MLKAIDKSNKGAGNNLSESKKVIVKVFLVLFPVSSFLIFTTKLTLIEINLLFLSQFISMLSLGKKLIIAFNIKVPSKDERL